MKKIFNYNKFLLLAAASTAFLFSCKPELDAVKPSAGEANFSKYISIGNSLTAGFADGGLYLEGQQVAYPNLIAAQLKHTGGSDFKSPFSQKHSATDQAICVSKTSLTGSQSWKM